MQAIKFECSLTSIALKPDIPPPNLDGLILTATNEYFPSSIENDGINVA